MYTFHTRVGVSITKPFNQSTDLEYHSPRVAESPFLTSIISINILLISPMKTISDSLLIGKIFGVSQRWIAEALRNGLFWSETFLP